MYYIVKLRASDIQVTADNRDDAYEHAKEDAHEFSAKWNYEALGAEFVPATDPDNHPIEFDLQCTAEGSGKGSLWTFDGYLNVTVEARSEIDALAHAPTVPKTGQYKAAVPEEISYIDARGATMSAMDFAEALEIVHEMALSNQIEPVDIAFGGKALVAKQAWQQEAIDTLHDFVVNHVGDLEVLITPGEHIIWPDAVWDCKRELSSTDVTHAIRICLEMAETGQIDPKDAVDAEMAEMIDRQNQAFEITRTLLGAYGFKLAEVKTIDISSLKV